MEVTLEQLIEDFELRYLDWRWLMRSDEAGYFVHLMSPTFHRDFNYTGDHYHQYADNPAEAFRLALAQMEKTDA